MKRKLSVDNQVVNLKNVIKDATLSNEEELELLDMRIKACKFDFRKVAKLAAVKEDDIVINEFRRFLVLKAITFGMKLV